MNQPICPRCRFGEMDAGTALLPIHALHENCDTPWSRNLFQCPNCRQIAHVSWDPRDDIYYCDPVDDGVVCAAGQHAGIDDIWPYCFDLGPDKREGISAAQYIRNGHYDAQQLYDRLRQRMIENRKLTDDNRWEVQALVKGMIFLLESMRQRMCKADPDKGVQVEDRSEDLFNLLDDWGQCRFDERLLTTSVVQDIQIRAKQFFDCAFGDDPRYDCIATSAPVREVYAP